MKFKKKVVSTERDGPRFVLALERQHRVVRKVKRRRFRLPVSKGIWSSEEDPPPSWVYCEICAEDRGAAEKK